MTQDPGRNPEIRIPYGDQMAQTTGKHREIREILGI